MILLSLYHVFPDVCIGFFLCSGVITAVHKYSGTSTAVPTTTKTTNIVREHISYILYIMCACYSLVLFLTTNCNTRMKDYFIVVIILYVVMFRLTILFFALKLNVSSFKIYLVTNMECHHIIICAVFRDTYTFPFQR